MGNRTDKRPPHVAARTAFWCGVALLVTCRPPVGDLPLNQPHIGKGPLTGIRSFTFSGRQNEYVTLSLRQEGIDLTLTLVPAGASPTITWDTPAGKFGTELLCLQLPVSGTYRIEVAALDPDHQGHFVLERRRGDSETARASLMGRKAVVSADHRDTSADAALLDAVAAWEAVGNTEQAGLAALHHVAYARRENRPRDALDSLDRALHLFHNQPDLKALTLQRKAVVCFGLGRVKEAIESLEEALDIRTTPDEDRASALEALAKCYGFNGAAHKAGTLYQEALGLLTAPHQRARKASLLAALGWNYHGTGNPTRALAFYAEAEATLGGTHPEIAFRLAIYRARTHITLDEPRTALRLLEEAVADDGFHLQPAMRRGLAVTRAEALLALDQFADAAALLEEPAAALAQTAPADVAHIHYLAGRAALGLGKMQEAREHVRIALAEADEVQAALPYALRLDYEGQRRRYADFMTELLVASEPPPAWAALAFSEARRARGLSAVTFNRGDDSLLKARLREAADQINAHLQAHGVGVYDAVLDDLLHAYDGLLYQAAEQTADLDAAVDIDPAALPAAPQTSVLVYAFGASRLFAWVLSPEGRHVCDLGDSRPIVAVLGDYLETVSDRDPAAQARAVPAAAYLSDRLLQPVWPFLQGTRLRLVPDGPLFHLPFAALPQPGKPPNTLPLGARFEIASAAGLHEAATPRRPENEDAHGALILADPRFASAAGALPGTAREAMSLQRLAARVGMPLKLLQGQDATRTGLLQEPMLRSAAFLHLATHGRYFAGRPSLSSLLLASPEEHDPQGRLLYPADINGTPIRAKLVVLSACESALGKNIRLLGRDGFAGAFLRAGADGVVAGLWRVDDAATAVFMEHLYTALWVHRLPPAKALQQAQSAMRADPTYQAPYYWASFSYRGGF